jgi:hypothetical protein
MHLKHPLLELVVGRRECFLDGGRVGRAARDVIAAIVGIEDAELLGLAAVEGLRETVLFRRGRQSIARC